ncbi:MAG: Cytosine deaminase [Devosia sp.]|uniref:cytosine deaminase n=1 Tax=Devosia sp. TaxID=1871048 RepID=UPI0026284D25|nr:cytosine deaminase [Devosia sp.]MDB5528165.1 Cytosine deaminase [Devosia sp.]
MADKSSFSATGTFVLKNATIPVAAMGQRGGRVEKRDISVVNGVIAAIEPSIDAPGGGTVYDCDNGLVLPAFVDIHTHLDKGHIWPRKENPDGTWLGALLAVHADRENLWASEDVERRMDFSLRCAYAHGTVAIRTHLDSAPPQHEISWALFEKMRDKWADRIELQAVAIIGPDTMVDPQALDAIARQVKSSGGLLGGSVAVFDRSKEAMLDVVNKAGELGLDLDLHTDETGDPAAHALLHLAEAVLETGYQGKVMAGHCCVLTVQDERTVKTTIDKVVEAGIAIVSLPMCNIYLQDRENGNGAVRTPIRRGVTLLNEFKAAGATVAIASDNTRDPFYAYGDLDGAEVFREGARILQFDHPQEQAWDWVRAVGASPADHGDFGYKATIAVGQPADFVIFRARAWSELMSRPQSDRIVIRKGMPIDTTLPDYRELDDLMGRSQ